MSLSRGVPREGASVKDPNGPDSFGWRANLPRLVKTPVIVMRNKPARRSGERDEETKRLKIKARVFESVFPLGIIGFGLASERGGEMQGMHFQL